LRKDAAAVGTQMRLCQWRPNSAAVTRRHNSVLDRLINAFVAPSSGTVRVNRTVERFDDIVRLDFIAIDDAGKTGFMIDVTMSLENCHAAFEGPRA